MVHGDKRYNIKLVELAPHELSVFRTLVSSNEIHSIHLVYYLEKYIDDMVLTEIWTGRMPLESRVAHFLNYVRNHDANKDQVAVSC